MFGIDVAPKEVVWSAEHSRLFYTEDYDYSRYVRYMDIDLATASFTDSRSSQYINGDRSVTGSINVVNDGEEVVIGSGQYLGLRDYSH